MSKSPAAIVKEKFGDKAKLVAAVQAFTTEDLWVARTNEDKGLARVSSEKLLKLHAAFTEVKGKFGDRFKLIDAILALQGRSKDADYRKALTAYAAPRLLDLHGAAKRRSSNAKKVAAKAAAK